MSSHFPRYFTPNISAFISNLHYIINYNTKQEEKRNKVGKPTLHLPNPSLFVGLDNFAYQMRFDVVK